MGCIKKFRFPVPALGCLLGFLLWGICLQPACSPKPREVIIRVGQTTITEQDVLQKIAVEKVYGNLLDRCDAIVMIVNQSIELEVSRSINIYPAPQEVAQFKNHATKTSKAPELLKRIFQIYEKDEKGLIVFFLAPKIANSKLTVYYNSTVSIKENIGFDKWLTGLAKDILIDIRRTECADEIALKYPSVWWNK